MSSSCHYFTPLHFCHTTHTVTVPQAQAIADKQGCSLDEAKVCSCLPHHVMSFIDCDLSGHSNARTAIETICTT